MKGTPILFTLLILLLGLSCRITATDVPPPSSTPTLTPDPTSTPTLPPFNYDPFRRPINVAGTLSPSPSCIVQSPDYLGFTVFPLLEIEKPQRGIPFQDPTYHPCLVRLTDHGRDLSAEDSSRGLSNESSRIQSFNADGSRLIIRGSTGSWYLYDTGLLRPKSRLPVSIEPRWDARDPDLLYSIMDTRWISYNLSSESITILHDFISDFPGISITTVGSRQNGSSSADGRFWGFSALDTGWKTSALLVFDLETRLVTAQRNIAGGAEISALTISPLGKYMVAEFINDCVPGTLGTESVPCGLMLFDMLLQQSRGLLPSIGPYDVALIGLGTEGIVFEDKKDNSISLINLENGELSRLLSLEPGVASMIFNISGRSLQNPGWALISTCTTHQSQSTSWMADVVFALELKAEGRAVRLASTHSTCNAGESSASPQVSTNPDMSRILFSSDWGNAVGETETYMIQLFPGWTSQVP